MTFHLRQAALSAAASLAVVLICALYGAGAAHALPSVTITEVQMNNDSVRVYFLPVAGAADYRAFTLDNPKAVKYAGIVHYIAPKGKHWVVESDGMPAFPYRYVNNSAGKSTPLRLDIPALDVELNGLAPKVPVQLVVEAVNHIGPAPYSNIPSYRNERQKGLIPAARASAEVDMNDPVGSNAGPTDDGFYSTNGQSGPDSDPRVIARSAPVRVTPTGVPTLPSISAAKQVLYDTFGKGTIDEIPGTRNIRAGRVSYLMHTDAAWRIDFENADVDHSRPFIMNRHYMDVLFDGSTPRSNQPLHVGHGVMALSPIRSVDFTDDRVLHVTMEVDAHVDSRRWLGIDLTSASDPITNYFPENAPLNKTNTAFMLNIYPDVLRTDLYVGKAHYSLSGAAGQAPKVTERPAIYDYQGLGLDSRSRFDLFVTSARYVVFEDGECVVDQAFPKPLPISLQHVKVYYTHFVYHTNNEINEVKTYRPWENVWLKLFPYSDERHWDNMGFEVLPKSYFQASDDELHQIILDSRNIKTVQAADLPR